MAQNIYDVDSFFQQYGQLPRSIHGLIGAPEWPTMRKLVGDIKDEVVIDLGCGMGWFCRYARDQGAKKVFGIDISENMLARARSFNVAESATPPIQYERQDLERLQLPDATYNLVYSSLTLHYLPGLESLFSTVHKSLVPGGRLVFSVEHPIMTAPKGLAFDGAYKRDENGAVFWPLNSYSIEGLRETEWLGTAGVRKHHHMLETYLTTLIKAGFTLTAVRESWDGMNRSPQNDEEDWGGHRPFLLIVSALKN